VVAEPGIILIIQDVSGEFLKTRWDANPPEKKTPSLYFPLFFRLVAPLNYFTSRKYTVYSLYVQRIMGYVMYGKVFGNLTIISANHMIKIEGNARKRNKYWLCRCKCGVEKYVSGRRLVAGKTKSCGCLKGHAPRTKNPIAKVKI